MNGSAIRTNRRQFLKGTTAMGLAAMLPLPAFARSALPSTHSVLTSSHWGAFEIAVKNGRLTGVTPFAADPKPTPMINNFPALVHDKTRITQPMVRQSWLQNRESADGMMRGQEPFVPVDWDTALDLVAEEQMRITESHGREAIFAGSYGWASAGRFHAADTLTNRYFAKTGGYVDGIGNYSYGAGMVLLPHILGSNQAISGPLTNWSVIAEHTDVAILFGGAAFKNGQISWGGTGAHTTEIAMQQAREAGVEFIAINPVLEDDAQTVDAEWIQIRPNTDTALMLALAQEVVTLGRADEAFLNRYTVGWPAVRDYLSGQSDGVAKTPEWASEITGISADWIRALANRISQSRTMLMTSWSLQRADHGEQSWWATILLASVLGQIGLPGGGFGFSYTSTNGIGMPVTRHAIPGAVRGRNPVRRAIPVARIADMLLAPGEPFQFNGEDDVYPEIRYIHWAGGNPFHHHQDLQRLTRAWAVPETIVVQEPWWTPTARRADIVLPATTTLERNDIGASIRDRWLFAMKQAIEPQAQARNDFDILADLADRLGQRSAFTEDRDESQWLRHIWEVGRERMATDGVELPDFDAFWETGAFELPEGDPDFVFLGDYREDPEAFALRTPSGRIELFSETIASFDYDDCPGHATWFAPREWLGAAPDETPLHLISSHPKWRLHSQMDNAPLAKQAKIAGREPIMINPQDAKARGISAGDVVEVYNERGRMLVGANVTDRVRPGVVVVYEGAWVDHDNELGIDIHGNPNTVIHDAGTSRLGQGCAAQTCLVAMRRYEAPAPAITVHDPPAIVT